MPRNLADVVVRRAEEDGDRIAFTFEDGRSWTFDELVGSSQTLRNQVLTRVAELSTHGVEGRRVLVYLQNSPEMVTTLVALWRAGVTAVPVNIMYKAEELKHALSMSAPILAITTPERVETIRKAGFTHDVITVDQVPEATDPSSGDQPVACNEADAIVLFTGGSTGLPKAVTVTHDGFGSSIEQLAAAAKGRPGPYPLVEPNRAPNLISFPLFHAGGINALLFAWTVGRAVLLMERFRAKRVLDLVEQYQVDNLFLLPTMMYDLVEIDGAENKLASVGQVLASGQELNPVLRRRFEEKFNVPIQSNYGSTEVGHVAGWTTRDIKAGRWVPGAVGVVYDGVDVEIRDEDGSAVAHGTIGELWVKTEVTRGYVGGGKVDASLLVVDGWVRTQDVGYLDDGNRLFLSGRARDMIKCGGFQVWPSEIEEAILRSPVARDVAVLPQKDDRLGEMPVAFVVPTDTASEDEDGIAAAIVEHCRAELAHYKVPRKVVIVDAIPRNDAGKTDKVTLAKALHVDPSVTGALS